MGTAGSFGDSECLNTKRFACVQNKVFSKFGTSKSGQYHWRACICLGTGCGNVGGDTCSTRHFAFLADVRGGALSAEMSSKKKGLGLLGQFGSFALGCRSLAARM